MWIDFCTRRVELYWKCPLGNEYSRRKSEWIQSIRIRGTKYCMIISRIWPPWSTKSLCLILSISFFFSRYKARKTPHFEGRRKPSDTPYLLGNTELCHLVSYTYRGGNSEHMSLIVGYLFLVWFEYTLYGI